MVGVGDLGELSTMDKTTNYKIRILHKGLPKTKLLASPVVEQFFIAHNSMREPEKDHLLKQIFIKFITSPINLPLSFWLKNSA